MKHRPITWWRVLSLLLALVVMGAPAEAARHHRSRRTARAVRKTSHSVRHARTKQRTVHASARVHHRTTRRVSHTAQARPARTYIVCRGDTVEAIAKRLGTSQQVLVSANGLRNRHRLSIGQVLRVPGTGKSPAPRPVQVAKATCESGSLVTEALRYRGTPYVYAGMTSRGMDCSGLVARVLISHGIRAPHNAASLYGLGTPVPYEKMRPGDLVFFHTRGRGISHVGIYMGNSEFVHASSGSGRVTTNRLDTGYYRQRYVGARRLTK